MRMISGLTALVISTGVAWGQEPAPAPAFTQQEPTYTTAEDIGVVTAAATEVPPDLVLRAQAQGLVAAALLASDEGPIVGARANQTLPGCNPAAARFSWVDNGAVTPVRDQRTCGACYIFAATGAFESSWKLQNNQTIDVSEQQALDCMNNVNGCSGGWHDSTLAFLQNHGLVNEANYRYQSQPSGACRTDAGSFRAVTWSYVDRVGAQASVAAIKNALCVHGPVISAVYASNNFKRYRSGVFNDFDEGMGSSSVNHDVLIVGWDDARDAWRIKNSWSTRWGESGFMWLRYRSNQIGFGAAWVDAARIRPDVGAEQLTVQLDNLQAESGKTAILNSLENAPMPSADPGMILDSISKSLGKNIFQ